MVAGKVGGEDLALDAAMAEPARYDDPGRSAERPVEGLLRERLRVDPADLDVDAMRPTGVLKGLGDGKLCVGQLDVLAAERDLAVRLVCLEAHEERSPPSWDRLSPWVAQAALPNHGTAQPASTTTHVTLP